MVKATRLPWIHSVALAYESDKCLMWPFSLRGNYPALIGTYGHIYLCELVNGPKPRGMETEHTCGVSACMNKRHLQWATHADNCKRRTEHGTQLIGEKHNMVKLSEYEVRYIRSSPDKGVDIAEAFCVSTALISLIRNRKIWRHI